MAKRLYLSPPHMGNAERKLLLDAYDSNWIAPLGPHVDAFEHEMCKELQASYAVALSSGTAALHLSLVLLGVQQGDEVFCSTLTFASTANAITYVGATPVFVDSDSTTWNMDPVLLAEELEKRALLDRLPKAVIVVDLYGQCADYDEILSACQKYAVPVIEDAAEALGATYKGRAAGTLGEMGILSFNGNKIITTSSGGMLLVGNKSSAERARFLASQARDPAPHYQHSIIGYNYRMSNLLAAVGRGQLKVLGLRVTSRRRINKLYRQALQNIPGIAFMPDANFGQSNCWLTCILIDMQKFGASVEEIRLNLEKYNIEARPVWKPMHLQPVFRGCKVVGGRISEELFARGLCLPSGSSMTQQDVDRVITHFMETAQLNK